jgi:hypothetical protein
MAPDGWTLYEFRRPPSGVLCEFARLVDTNQSPGHPQEQGKWVGFVGDLKPEANSVGLYWRLTGIGREYLDRLTPEARAQIEPMGLSGSGVGHQMANALLGHLGSIEISSALSDLPLGGMFEY